MRYLADILTFFRIILSVLLLYLAFSRVEIGLGLIVFLLGELTDAFDGTCATKWPFPKEKTPWYRKYAAKYDMFADAFLAFSMIVFFSFRVNLVAGLTIFLFYAIMGLMVEFLVYGKLFGHPDDCTKDSLMRRDFKLAKRLIMIRRGIYLGLMALISLITLYASGWILGVKIGLTVLAAGVSVFLWFFLSQRRHNISRDAVGIEKELAKKTSKQGSKSTKKS